MVHEISLLFCYKKNLSTNIKSTLKRFVHMGSNTNYTFQLNAIERNQIRKLTIVNKFYMVEIIRKKMKKFFFTCFSERINK